MAKIMYRDAIVAVLLMREAHSLDPNGEAEDDISNSLQTAMNKAARPTRDQKIAKIYKIEAKYNRIGKKRKDDEVLKVLNVNNAETLKQIALQKDDYPEFGMYIVAHGYYDKERNLARITSEKLNPEKLANLIEAIGLGEKLTKISIAACSMARDAFTYSHDNPPKMTQLAAPGGTFLGELAKQLFTANKNCRPKIGAYTHFMTGNYEVTQPSKATLPSRQLRNLERNVLQADSSLRPVLDKAKADACTRVYPNPTSEQKLACDRFKGKAFGTISLNDAFLFERNLRDCMPPPLKTAIENEERNYLQNDVARGSTLIGLEPINNTHVVPARLIRDDFSKNFREYRAAVQADEVGNVKFLTHAEWTDKAVR